MKNLFSIIILFILVTNCGFKKRVDHHGVHLLKKKSDMIIVAETNKNDIIKLLGPPYVKSTFNNDLYFYIERKTTTGKLIKLGKKKYLENNVLVLEIDDRGILLKKEFYDLNKMKEIKIGLKGYKYLDEAIELYQKSIVLKPLNPNAFNNIGLIYLEKKNFFRILMCYLRSIPKDV